MTISEKFRVIRGIKLRIYYNKSNMEPIILNKIHAINVEKHNKVSKQMIS